MKRRTEITIETERVVFVAGEGRDRDDGLCRECGTGARVMPLEEAAARLRVHTQTMLRIAVAAGLHLTPTADGTTLVCLGPPRGGDGRPAPNELNAEASDLSH